jgi:hypothetical protein
MPTDSIRTSCIVSFVLTFSGIAGWQAAYCHLTSGGNPTALFLIGDRKLYPEALKKNAYIYRDSLGYDGMIYRLIAYDPLLATGYQRYVDDPRYRYRRILLPALAALAAGGNPERIDLAYILTADILMAAGGACFALLLLPFAPATLSSLLYCLIPAVVATTDRMVLDGVAFAAFLALLLFYRRDRPAALVGMAAILPLIREIALMLTAGAALACLRARRFRLSAALSAAVLPALGWFWLVAGRTPPSPAATSLLAPPLWPYVERLFTRAVRPVSPVLNLGLQAVDAAACAAMLFAFGYYFQVLAAQLRQRKLEGETLLLGPFVALSACYGAPSLVSEPYDFTRYNSVLLVWTFLRIFPARRMAASAFLLASAAPTLVYRAAPLLRAISG